MKLLESGSGIDTEYGKIYVNKEVLFEEVFNGTIFPGYYCEPNSVAAVEIGYFDLTELVELPCENITIKKALCRLSADSINDCNITVDSTQDISDEWSERITEVEKTKDLFGLNRQLKTEDIRLNRELPVSIFNKEVTRQLRENDFAVSNGNDSLNVMTADNFSVAPSGTKGVSRFQMLIDKLPGEHKARWFAGAALNSSDQAMASVMSTALSRLNSFIDSELEQILCFDTSIDVEEFCNSKSAIYLVLPEEDATKHFLISLIFQQLYREILTVADEKGGQLDKRVMFYMDEIGTLPKVDGLEMIFSASRSRKVSIVAIIQSLAQFEKTYGKEGAEIIVDNCQCTLFGAFAPNSKTAEAMSQNLGKQTVLSVTVTRSSGRDGGNRQLQMIERPLMTVDELKSMPKGHFIVMKTGCHPMKTRLKLFFKWGIQFEDAYSIEEKSERKVQYAVSREVEAAVLKKFPPKPIPIEFSPEFEDMDKENALSKKRAPKTRSIT